MKRFVLPLAAFAMFASPAAGAAVPLRAAQVPRVAGLFDLGRAPANMPVQLTFTLPYRDEGTLDALVTAFGNPSSPLFRQHLTAAQFREAFSPAAGAYAATIAVLQHAGLRIARTYPNRTVIDAVAPARTVETLFGTELHRVMQPGQGVRYTNVHPAQMPAHLMALVSDATGFDNLQRMHFHAARAHAVPFVPDDIGKPLHGPDGGYGPLAFADGYNLPVQHGFDGTGRTAGIMIGGDPSDADLAAYLAHFHETRTGTTTRVSVDGGPGNDSGDQLTATLEYETTASLAPGANIVIYETDEIPFNEIIDAYNQAVSDDVVETLDSAFGICETAEPSFAKQSEHIAKQGAALGIVFHASTGDAGDQGDDCSGGGVDAPASGPSFVAVGGTTLSVAKNGSYYAETAWPYSGGGISDVFKLPSYQKNVHVQTRGRNVPDLAFDGDPQEGESFFYMGSFIGPIGGTGLSSAIFSAIAVELDQVRGTAFAGGFNPSAYAAFLASGYGKGKSSYFHDIVHGSNGYDATKGYDLVTGIGSADAYNLAAILQ